MNEPENEGQLGLRDDLRHASDRVTRSPGDIDWNVAIRVDVHVVSRSRRSYSNGPPERRPKAMLESLGETF
jgi:hypothetical protein